MCRYTERRYSCWCVYHHVKPHDLCQIAVSTSKLCDFDRYSRIPARKEKIGAVCDVCRQNNSNEQAAQEQQHHRRMKEGPGVGLRRAKTNSQEMKPLPLAEPWFFHADGLRRIHTDSPTHASGSVQVKPNESSMVRKSDPVQLPSRQSLLAPPPLKQRPYHPDYGPASPPEMGMYSQIRSSNPNQNTKGLNLLFGDERRTSGDQDTTESVDRYVTTTGYKNNRKSSVYMGKRESGGGEWTSALDNRHSPSLPHPGVTQTHNLESSSPLRLSQKDLNPGFVPFENPRPAPHPPDTRIRNPNVARHFDGTIWSSANPKRTSDDTETSAAKRIEKWVGEVYSANDYQEILDRRPLEQESKTISHRPELGQNLGHMDSLVRKLGVSLAEAGADAGEGEWEDEVYSPSNYIQDDRLSVKPLRIKRHQDWM